MTTGDRRVEILEEADAATDALRVRRELDQVDPVEDREGAGEIGEEDRAGLERRDQQRLAALELGGEQRAQVGYAGRDLDMGEVDLSDLSVGRRIYEASFSWYRWARRSMSRR